MNFSSDNYWINIDKPIGFSSAKIVAIVKKITGAKKVGHGGTLDPFASGVLPIAVNKATKSSDYILKSDKKYYFEISWGEMRDTDDVEGKVTLTSSKRPTTLEIIQILPHFLGNIFQTPSKFSAIKINGKKAYELARNNEEFFLKSRSIFIQKIHLIFNNFDKAGFEVECSKGTYIRTLSHDLAVKLNCCGYVSTLRRLQAGIFTIQNIISLDKLKNLTMFGQIDDSIVKLRDVLNFMVELAIDDDLTLKVKNGQAIQLKENLFNFNSESLVKIINNDELIGLGIICKNTLKPVNIFNNS